MKPNEEMIDNKYYFFDKIDYFLLKYGIEHTSNILNELFDITLITVNDKLIEYKKNDRLFIHYRN